jgi:hypothetical protein
MGLVHRGLDLNGFGGHRLSEVLESGFILFRRDGMRRAGRFG